MRGDFSGFDALNSADCLAAIKDILWGGDGSIDNTLFKAYNFAFKDISFVAHQAGHGEGVKTVGMILKNLIFCIPNAIRNIGKGKPPPVETTILHGISGVFRPRRITLVLGQPGSGKSTLFRALSGSLKSDASQRVSGTTMFGHLNMSKVHRGNFVTMVQQIDVHHSTLTTRETLDFARRCRQYHVEKYNTRLSDNVRNQMDLRAFKKLAGQQTNMNLAMLGLIRCGDTVVGDENLKGISGGEKRRVTLGEMLISRTRVQLLDEISTGLDSASTLDIIKALKAQSRIFNTTPVISLLQPPPETFVEFDDLLLLDSGRIVYFTRAENELV